MPAAASNQCSIRRVSALSFIAMASLTVYGGGSSAAETSAASNVREEGRQTALAVPKSLAWVRVAMGGEALTLQAARSVHSPAPAPSPARAPAPAPGPSLNEPKTSARLFISGHSLTDNLLPDYIESIAQSLNTQIWWNQQNIPGSPTRFRTRGSDTGATVFPGYSTGKNRQGSGMNIVNELRQPQTIGGQRYDTLILTERHDVIETIRWEDTVRYTRHFHDRLIDGNPQANTYLYHSWLGIPDKNNPGNWVAYERTVAPVWQCVASRINQSLTAVGRADRLVYLPAGPALAELVDRATRASGVAGVTAATVRETVDRLFTDDVHLTQLGMYYMALVNYASVYRRSPVGAWAPAGVSATQASSLQFIAWQFVSNHYNTYTQPELAQCRAAMRDTVCSAFSNFTGRLDQTAGCVNFFSATTQNNPFNYNAATDSAYWFPAP